MAKFKLPQLTTAQRTGLVLDAREIVFDTDEEILYYGDGSTVGGLSLIGPAGPQGPPGTLTALKDDPSPQLANFLDPDGNYVGSDKGSDLPSASPLVIGVDGDYFDVTGSTGFSTMTVAANRFFMLRFDGVLIITNGGPITIPGTPSNFTTTIGDHLLCFSTAINTVRIVAATKIDGTAIATNLKDDPSPQLADFLDPDGHYIGSAKGVDLASASPLIIGIDGDFFNITGTTGFNGITVADDRNFTLEFDDALIITVGAGITLNNAGGDFTTSAGDIIKFQSTAEDVVVGVISKADGTSPTSGAGGGAWTLINSIEADNDSSLIITGLDSTYDTYAIIVSNMHPTNNAVQLKLRVGDSAGIDQGATDYAYHTQTIESDAATYSAVASAGATSIEITGTVGGGTGQGCSVMLYLYRSSDSSIDPMFTGQSIADGTSDFARGGALVARRLSAINLDRIQILYSNGDIESGRLTIWGIAHE